ncbi:hypothetical protein VP01_71g15 [Puccinia sorghi]|uniref:Uncharacterized protein n=1 Tax=Puccinia sorghi TaxID=27349 RepID=A0A0L6UE55_9BASI|nr:hypothetical protein VP01_71g15 [Puccinia sorghi]
MCQGPPRPRTNGPVAGPVTVQPNRSWCKNTLHSSRIVLSNLTLTMIELAATFLLLVIGITVSAPPLKNIHWKAELKRRWVMPECTLNLDHGWHQLLSLFGTLVRSIDGFDSKMGFINLNTRASKVRSAS